MNDNKKYCLRRLYGKQWVIWELDGDNVPTGVCLRGYERRGLISVYPDKYGEKKLFDADVRAFVPLHRVVCRWDSQVNAIKSDAANGLCWLIGELPESVESRRRRERGAASMEATSSTAEAVPLPRRGRQIKEAKEITV